MVRKVKPKKYALDNVKNSAVAFATRKIKSGTFRNYTVRRSGDGRETEIGFTGGLVDLLTLLSHANGNVVANIPLGVDGNADGVSDGWSKDATTLTTVTTSIEESAQKISFTNANSNSVNQSFSKIVTCRQGESITFTIKYKTDNAYARFAVTENPSGTVLNTVFNKTSAGSYTTETITVTSTTAGTTSVNIILAIRAINTGDNGSAWFKDAVVINSNCYVTSWFDANGNYNATNINTISQPQIVVNGSIYTGTSGYASLYYDNSNDYLEVQSLNFTNISIYTALTTRAGTFYKSYVSKANSFSLSQYEANMRFGVTGATSSTVAGMNLSGGSHQILARYDLTNVKLKVNNIAEVSNASNVAIPSNSNKIYIGSDGSTSSPTDTRSIIIFDRTIIDVENEKLKRYLV